MKTINLGNNEQIASGITKLSDGTFLAVTFSKSRHFKTMKSAEKWLEKNNKRTQA